MIVIVCPGQGSQIPGFLQPWLAEPQFAEHLDSMADTIGMKLREYGTTSDTTTIRKTEIAQPLIVAAGLLTLRPLLARSRETIGGIAGHSVGEITAAAGAGILSDRDALAFVRVRGQAMADAASRSATGMSAVVGADECELLAQLAELGLQPANFNGAGQIVVAGALDGLAQLRETPPPRARVIPLQVAGAFHTDYMASAIPLLKETAVGLPTHNPNVPIWTNKDGSQVSNGRDFLEHLIAQVSSPVRWDECMRSFVHAGVTGIIELAPAGALTGLAKRALKDVPVVAITTPDDLEAAYDLLTTGAATTNPTQQHTEQPAHRAM